ncbi:MAG TPA: LLM class flavin-dependent oxidoreductase [Solirubrobacterales bacterium]|jgi:alkanesulfonate monooxygenase SsuD/methylene tetrahydromethanopterin reductase-like flavin-dependent oxidoreductase (luciferase family)
MDIAIGLPNAVPGTTGEQLTEWARRAEKRGFSSLGTIDRVTYPSYEPLIALSAAAAVTERIGLVTAVLLAPLRLNGGLLAKQTLSLNALSGGRLTLGVGIGGRDDDFAAIGVDMGSRGNDVDKILSRLTEAWADDAIGPVTPPPRLVVGGAVQASYERAAKYGSAGWIAGGLPPDQFAESLGKAKEAWAAAGREGEPVGMALAYYALGDDPEGDANRYLTHYYGFLGEETAGYIAGSAAKDAETVQAYLAAFEGAGCDELILFPSSNDPDQVDYLADAAGL